MCKCEMEGLVTMIGLNRYKCDLKENDNCIECRHLSRFKKHELMSRLDGYIGFVNDVTFFKFESDVSKIVISGVEAISYLNNHLPFSFCNELYNGLGCYYKGVNFEYINSTDNVIMFYNTDIILSDIINEFKYQDKYNGIELSNINILPSENDLNVKDGIYIVGDLALSQMSKIVLMRKVE